MRNSSETHGRNVFARLALIGLVSGAVAGCSSDTTRFVADSPVPPPAGGAYAGGYQGQGQVGYGGGGDVTGSLGAAPSSRVESAPLPPPGQAPGSAPGYGAAPAYGAPRASAPPSGSSGPGFQPSSYASAGGTQPLYGAPGYAAATPAGRPAAAGTHVVVEGETLGSISRMYNVSVASLTIANNIPAGGTVRTGQSLIIPPGGNGTSQARAAQAAPAAKPPQAAAAQQTLAPPAAGKPAPAPAATAAAKPAPTAPVTAQAAPPVAPASGKTVAAAPTQAVAKSNAPEPKVETAAKVTPADDADDAPRASGSGPQFRAPVRGRVIASFGPKPGGTHNDGVNFAVPEGTAVRAAEDGTVAYAGNELKGYGNLVLIKHADGYVTAYAHNSELSVKRGDTVRRGQIVAKAGQSGNVNSPQLHFEIRKGSTAVDPSSYVAGL
ncbi:peptidoglycan DD-metalloendopeptidase family protein [Xanthobacter sp. KR7-65]|uniref:peptidoglycan DD-metalloendopeptidase family protein n=1 Tax=Xanthobacter sp. KR7-65 TaxID=3156612 RepID=UPI0032B359F8